jgi:hypothetical protein
LLAFFKGLAKPAGLFRSSRSDLVAARHHNGIAFEDMTVDIALMLKFMIGVGVVITAAAWAFYFFWLRPRQRREEERINRKLDTF